MARARGQAPGSGGRRRPRRGSPGTGPRGESAGLLLLLLQVLPPGAAAGSGRRGTRGPGGGCVCWPGAGPALPRDARLLLLLPPRPPPSPPPSSTAAVSPSRMVISSPRGRRGRAGGGRGGRAGSSRGARPPPPPTTAVLGSRQSAPLGRLRARVRAPLSVCSPALRPRGNPSISPPRAPGGEGTASAPGDPLSLREHPRGERALRLRNSV